MSYQNPATTPTIADLNQQVDDTRVVLLSACDKLVERGETIDDIHEKATILNTNAVSFRQNSARLRNRMWWKEKKTTLIIFMVVLVFLLIIILPLAINN